MTIPQAGQSWLGKPISALIRDDVKVLESGSVIGTLNKVTGFAEFNKSNIDEQSGHYFPFELTKSGTKMTLKKNGTAEPGKTGMDFDSQIIFRVPNTETTFTVEVDDSEVVTLNFAKATLA